MPSIGSRQKRRHGLAPPIRLTKAQSRHPEAVATKPPSSGATAQSAQPKSAAEVVNAAAGSVTPIWAAVAAPPERRAARRASVTCSRTPALSYCVAASASWAA